jgi:diadenosine tetraphosphate (Ap4A) HIT family hydrolase
MAYFGSVNPVSNPGPAAYKIPANDHKRNRPGKNAGPIYCNPLEQGDLLAEFYVLCWGETLRHAGEHDFAVWYPFRSLVYPGSMIHDSQANSKESGCPFCEMSDERVVWENELAYAIRDSFPVTPLHTLVIPKRHVRGYFAFDHAELEACHRLLEREKAAIEREDRAVDGFNVGINDGRVAGQTVFHCHIHLIARREHDVEDPRGGVRSVIPGKAAYL